VNKIVNHLQGFVKVEAVGDFPERFVNICTQHGIAFWSVRTLGEHRMEAVLNAKDLRKAKRLAEKSGCNLAEKRKRGVPFFLSGFKHRWALIGSLVFCLAALLISSRYIWRFDVEGNEVLTQEEILSALSEAGIKTGSPVRDVDIVSIRNQMLEKLDKLAWITVNVSGSRAHVVARERKEKPEIIPKDIPTNVVAAKSGLITQVDAMEGSSKAFEGDLVEAGDLIVSGIIDSETMGIRLVHAHADITARTWYELEAVLPATAQGKQYSGKSKEYKYLIVTGKKIPLSFEPFTPFEFYDKIKTSSSLTVPGELTFPLTLVEEIYAEYTPVNYRVDEELAETLLSRSLENSLSLEIDNDSKDGKILRSEMSCDTEGAVFRGKLEAECLEEIGVMIAVP